MIGPQIKPGYKSTANYHHQSVLRTMLEALGNHATFPPQPIPRPNGEFFKARQARPPVGR